VRIKVSSIVSGIIVLGGLSLLPAGSAVACARDFPVFFTELGSDTIHPRSDQMIDGFVSFLRDQRLPDPAYPVSSCGPLRPGDYKVVVLAHADDPGIRDQCTLSFARGHAVRARLIALGIPEASIAVEAFGDRRKLIPTEPGIGDPQNRRVNLMIVDASSIEDRSPYPRWRNPFDGLCPEPGRP
jgi:hypothetical protein